MIWSRAGNLHTPLPVGVSVSWSASVSRPFYKQTITCHPGLFYKRFMSQFCIFLLHHFKFHSWLFWPNNFINFTNVTAATPRNHVQKFVLIVYPLSTWDQLVFLQGLGYELAKRQWNASWNDKRKLVHLTYLSIDEIRFSYCNCGGTW